MSKQTPNPKPQTPNPKSQVPDLKSRIPNPGVLARITGNPALARAVPLLRPEVVHAVITHCGLRDSGDLLALVTTEQLEAVFDLDLWTPSRDGRGARFDAARFCEWLETLVDAGPELAAARLAQMDVAIVVAGLSPNIRVFDPAVFSPVAEASGADPMLNPGGERDVHVDIGGYIVIAERPDAWDVVVAALVALNEHQPDTFHRVMHACRALSNSGKERDGLDDLLPDTEQAHFDLSSGREQRRDRLGFLSAEQARAFLDGARRGSLEAMTPYVDPLWVAYQRSFDAASEERVPADALAFPGDDGRADTTTAAENLIDVLRGAGVIADAPRALLPGADDQPPVNPALEQYLRLRAAADSETTEGEQELAFLANVLMVAGSLQGRPFTRRETKEAVAATCNLGLEYWPRQWGAPETRDLVTVFRTGWAVLHRDVSMPTSEAILNALGQIRSTDRDLQVGLHALQRELRGTHAARMPWRTRARLDVLASLDLPAWAALTALLGEYPVMLSNVSLVAGRHPLTVNPNEFQLIAEQRHVAAIREFLRSLTDLLTR